MWNGAIRELSFKKGDIIHIRREIDKNWYEGEINATVGLLPANYVEVSVKYMYEIFVYIKCAKSAFGGGPALANPGGFFWESWNSEWISIWRKNHMKTARNNLKKMPDMKN